MSIANKYNLYVIEDCAQAHGCLYKQKLEHLEIYLVLVFIQGKNLGAFGDGGAIITNNDNLNLLIRKMKNLGSIIKYKHEVLGRNSRLDSIQAAVLNVKLKYLESNNSKRREVAELFQLLQNISQIKLQEIENYCIPVYHLFVIRLSDPNEMI